MKYNRFEELPVWQDAIELAVRIFNLTSQAEFGREFTLKDQIERQVFPSRITSLRASKEGQLRRLWHSSIFPVAPRVKFDR